jgi:hypothetical protein
MNERGLSRRIFLTGTATAGAMASCAAFSSSPALASSDRTPSTGSGRRPNVSRTGART